MAKRDGIGIRRRTRPQAYRSSTSRIFFARSASVNGFTSSSTPASRPAMPHDDVARVSGGEQHLQAVTPAACLIGELSATPPRIFQLVDCRPRRGMNHATERTLGDIGKMPLQIQEYIAGQIWLCSYPVWRVPA